MEITLSGELGPFNETLLAKLKRYFSPKILFAGYFLDTRLSKAISVGKPIHYFEKDALIYSLSAIPYELEELVYYLHMLRENLGDASIIPTMVVSDALTLKEYVERLSEEKCIAGIEIDVSLQRYAYTKMFNYSPKAVQVLHETLDTALRMKKEGVVEKLFIKGDIDALTVSGMLRKTSLKTDICVIFSDSTIIEHEGRVTKVFRPTPPSLILTFRKLFSTKGSKLSLGISPNSRNIPDILEAVAILKSSQKEEKIYVQLFYPIIAQGYPFIGQLLEELRKKEYIFSAKYNTVIVDEELCTLCEKCITICPYNALRRKGSTIEVHDKKCTACGACIVQCPTGALKPAFLVSP